MRDVVRNLLMAFRPLLRLDTLWRIWPFLISACRYRGLGGRAPLADFYPCLLDRSTTTPIDYNYFYQDTWAAGQVFSHDPQEHVDIGSTALLVGILAQRVRVISVDIRPLTVRLPGLETRVGSIVDLPFDCDSVHSLSSLCVIEHIGLGRYGDPLDAHGSLRALAEIQRVLAPGGRAYLSLPVGPRDRTRFNAHRIFDWTTIASLMPELELEEERFILGDRLVERTALADHVWTSAMVVGCFAFRKPLTGRTP